MQQEAQYLFEVEANDGLLAKLQQGDNDARLAKKSKNKQPTQPTQMLATEVYVNQLKLHANEIMGSKYQSLSRYIALKEEIIRSKYEKTQKMVVGDYLKKAYTERLEIFSPSDTYLSSVQNLILIMKEQISNLLLNLTELQRRDYQETANLSKKYQQKVKIEYSPQLFTITGMLKLDIIVLFYHKNYYYQTIYNIQNLIAPKTIKKIFSIEQEEFLRFRTQFEQSMNVIRYKYRKRLSKIILLFTIVQLKHTIYRQHKQRLRKPFVKAINLTEHSFLSHLVLKKDKSAIYFPFSQIAFESRGNKLFKNLPEAKKDEVIKKMQALMNQISQHRRLQMKFIEMKQQYGTSLQSLLHLYEKLNFNPGLQVKINEKLENQLYQDVQICKWMYLNRGSKTINKSRNTFFYRQGNKIAKYQASSIIIIKIALERYNQLALICTLLFKNMKKVGTQPIQYIYICRFEYSYNKIKGISSGQQQDLKFTHIIGVDQSGLCLSAGKRSHLRGKQFKEFLLDYFLKFSRKRKYSVVLYELSHNNHRTWDQLGNIIYDFKMKQNTNVFLANSPQKFKLHLQIYTRICWLLMESARSLRQNNFHSKVDNFKRMVITALILSKNQKIMVQKQCQTQKEFNLIDQISSRFPSH